MPHVHPQMPRIRHQMPRIHPQMPRIHHQMPRPRRVAELAREEDVRDESQSDQRRQVQEQDQRCVGGHAHVGRTGASDVDGVPSARRRLPFPSHPTGKLMWDFFILNYFWIISTFLFA